MLDHLAPVAAALRVAAPLPDAHPAVVAILEKQVRSGPDGEPQFLDANGDVRLVSDRGWQPMNVAEFVADLKHTRGDLFQGAKPDAKAETTQTAAPANVTALMSAMKRGDATAAAQLHAMLKAR